MNAPSPAASAAPDRIVYLDYNATTPVAPEVRDAMLPYLGDHFGNPSSTHRLGNDARLGVERARRKVARLLGCDPDELVLTGGGSESDNLAIKGALFAARLARGGPAAPAHVITAAAEHKAVLEAVHDLATYHGVATTILPVDATGRVDPADLRAAFRPETLLVSIMFGNNEVGTIQPVADLAAACRERGVLFHCDGVQAFGQVPVDVRALGVDLFSLSGHKLYAPKGVGALYVRRGVALAPLVSGGSQEAGRRAGTENAAGIVALGAAVDLAARGLEEEAARKVALRDRLWAGLRDAIPDIHLNGHPTERLPGTLHVGLPGVAGQQLVVTLSSRAGICCSAGSACTSDAGCGVVQTKISHVLAAMGIETERARGSLRLSLGRYSTEEDVAAVLAALPPLVAEARARLAAAASPR